VDHKANTMKKSKENSGGRQKSSPARGSRDSRKFTSYDTRRPETSTPQKVCEGNESPAERARFKKAGAKGM